MIDADGKERVGQFELKANIAAASGVWRAGQVVAESDPDLWRQLESAPTEQARPRRAADEVAALLQSTLSDWQSSDPAG